MRRSVVFYINGDRHEITGAAAFQPLTDYLRYARGLTGTKVVCAEGDCGACTVLKAQEPDLDFIPINACITIPALLDGSHLVTVEGLEDKNGLHPAQDAMMRFHGAQCGFCTPGIVCALAGFFEIRNVATEKQARNALTGNLCRCTGYEPILKSATAVAGGLVGKLRSRYTSNATVTRELEAAAKQDLMITSEGRSFYAPVSLPRLLKYKKEHSQARIISAATDLGVLVNKGKASYQALCSLARIPKSGNIIETEDAITVGACVNLTVLQEAVKNSFPAFHDLLKIFASPQIKNAATLVGNIANASPIADTLPFLFVMNAELEIRNQERKRWVNINEFYPGYKRLDLAPDEVITAVRIPKLGAGENVELHKVSRRKDLDISCVTAGYFFKTSDAVVMEARITYGGVGPTVMRLPRTEEFLRGKTVTLDVFEKAGETAQAEVAPLSDVRGSREYRLKLVKNLLVKSFYEQSGRTKPAA